MLPKTALLVGTPAQSERKPFAANDLLFKPVCYYPVDAARQVGVEKVTLLLPRGDPRLADCFPPDTLGCEQGDPGPLERSGVFAGNVLLLADDAASLEPAHLLALAAREHPCVFVDGQSVVAAVIPGLAALAFAAGEGDLNPEGLEICDIHAACPETPYLGFQARSKRELLDFSQYLRQRILNRWLDFGVTMEATDGVLIGPDAMVGADTLLLPGTELRGRTFVGAGCVLGPNTVITDSVVADGCVVESSKLTGALLHERVKVGPFSQLRPGTELFDDVKVGDFVELKNSRIGEKTAVAHLTYIGDAEVGKRVNFGCGTVTCNYDGVNKYRTTIGNDAFIGCNTNLVAPVTVGEGAYTAAGTTVTQDVPPDALAVGRARQENRESWAAAFKDSRKR